MILSVWSTLIYSKTHCCQNQSVTGLLDSPHQVRLFHDADCRGYLNGTMFITIQNIPLLFLFIFPDFDLNTWYNNQGINPESVLSLVNKNTLLNELGISSYLSTNPCSFTSETFSPANSMGWKNGMFTDYSTLSLNCLTNLTHTIYTFIHLNVQLFCCIFLFFFFFCRL